jgi:hypothetical protein
VDATHFWNWVSVFILFQPWFADVICVCWSSDMAQSIRLAFEGAFYHVMARGNRRAAIFVDDQDRRFFCNALPMSAKKQVGVCMLGF